MNEELKKELDQVAEAGKRLARRFLIHKTVILLVALVAVIVCFRIMSPIPCLISELLILLIVRQFSVKSQRSMQSALYTHCDPYLQYAYLDEYSKLPFGKLKRAQYAAMVAKAQCMVLAGEPQVAISILQDVKDTKKLPAPTRAVCYNLLLRSYAQYGWDQKRSDLVAQVKKEMAAMPAKMSIYFDVILRLEDLAREQEAGNVEALQEYYDGNEGNLMFQKVSAHFALADVMLRAGRFEDAKEHMKFVRENGNKLYYIRELEETLEKQKGINREQAVEEVLQTQAKAAPQEEKEDGEHEL